MGTIIIEEGTHEEKARHAIAQAHKWNEFDGLPFVRHTATSSIDPDGPWMLFESRTPAARAYVFTDGTNRVEVQDA